MLSRIVNRTLLSAVHSKRTLSKVAAMDIVAIQEIKKIGAGYTRHSLPASPTLNANVLKGSDPP